MHRFLRAPDFSGGQLAWTSNSRFPHAIAAPRSARSARRHQQSSVTTVAILIRANRLVISQGCILRDSCSKSPPSTRTVEKRRKTGGRSITKVYRSNFSDVHDNAQLRTEFCSTCVSIKTRPPQLFAFVSLRGTLNWWRAPDPGSRAGPMNNVAAARIGYVFTPNPSSLELTFFA